MHVEPDRQSLWGNPPDVATILKAYQLDTLEPTTWMDYKDVRQSRALPVVVAGHVLLTDDKSQGRGGGAERWDTGNLGPGDDEDPLGLKTSLFDTLAKGNDYLRRGRNLTTKEFQLHVNSKAFNPRQFLESVHRQSSYLDLLAGIDHLKRTLAEKSEGLKALVQNNLDRFVSAKAAIDAIYEEMQGQGFADESDYGMRSLDTALTESVQIMDQTFGLVFKNQTKTAKIQNILIILEKFKSLFGMPSSMRRFLKQKKYDYVIKDYKKSKVIMEAMLASEASSDTISDNDSDDEDTLTYYHQIVFDHLSVEIAKIIKEMKYQLLRQLSEPWHSIQEQEEAMNFLAELDTNENPVWPYLNSQYKYILKMLLQIHKTHTQRIDVLKKSASEQPISEKDVTINLRQSIHLIDMQDLDSLAGSKDLSIMIWNEIFNFVKALSDVVLHHLPDFWKLAKSFIDGKFQKQSQATALDSVAQCHRMAKGVVDMYVSILTEFFQLGPPSNGSAQPRASSFPPHSNSPTTGYFLTRIVSEISDCVNIINVINMAPDAFKELSTLMEHVRWQFAELVCEAWNNDVEIFYKLEDWTVVHENRQITVFLRNFRSFERYNSRSAYKIASLGFVAESNGNKLSNLTRSIPDDLVTKIKKAFVDSLCSFFDGLVHLAFTQYSPEEVSEQPNELISLSHLDATNLDIRVLMTISNLSYLKRSMVPKLVHQVEQAYKCNLTDELVKLNKAIDERDAVLFDNYLKRKTNILRNIIIQGILKSGFNWHNISRPKEVHEFVCEALLSLVLVHAQVRDISHHLVDRVLRALIENLAKEYLSTFQKVKTFGIGGMLQATLDVEFTQLSLGKYVTSSAKQVINEVYITVDQQCDKNMKTGNLQTETQNVKKLLVASAQSTSLQFACFRRLE